MKTLLLLLINLFLLNATNLIIPISEKNDFHLEKALLGKKLFYEPRLSSDDTISCASCHSIEDGGDDGLDFSLGINDQKVQMNSPTILNSKYNFTQFWNGRAKSLEEQVSGPIHNPMEMNSSLEEIVKKLKKDVFYMLEFQKVYKNGITKKNIVDAIAEFERSLTTPNSKFDKYLKGDVNALDKDELEGYELFKSNGCISCHNGINIGGNLFQKMGILKEYKSKKSDSLGRFDITNDEEDKNYFKVPTLRNINKTAPYFHDASANSLKKAVSVMIEYQLGIKPIEDEVEKIVKFLRTLDGELPKIMEQN